MMNNEWTNRWNERYAGDEYAYGREPNEYLRAQLAKQQPGTILFPAEGEGRNAVYAAKLGWHVSAFDISSEGKNKALKLSAANGVDIDYQVGELDALHYQPAQFDALALIYAHFPADIKSRYHKTLSGYLALGGILIFEAFSKKHLDYIAKDPNVGGPRDMESLFSIDEIRSDFTGYDIIELSETEIELSEGAYHKGLGSVIRFLGRKRS